MSIDDMKNKEMTIVNAENVDENIVTESPITEEMTSEPELNSFIPDPPYKRVKVKDFDSFMKKTKLYIKYLWGKMDIFCKITIILAIITLLLFVASVVLLKTAPIIFSVFQIIFLVVAFLIYKGIITRIPSWVKFIVLGLAGLLIIVNVASYSWTDNEYAETTVHVNTPYSSEECLGKNYNTVKSDLEAAGFVNISEEIIEDVELTETDKNGMIESVSINGISDFSANEKFNSLAKIIITYHSYKHINAPVSSADAKTMEPTDLLKAFSDAGFINISTAEEFDLDPDSSSLGYENQVIINEEEIFDTNTRIPVNADIKIITHRAYEKYTLKLSIDFAANLIFSTYDVEMSLGEKTETLTHGQDAEFEWRLQPGKYTLSFENVDSSSVNGSVDLEIAGDTEASYKINCYSDRVEVSQQMFVNKSAIKDNEAMVPMSASFCIFEDYKDIQTVFKDAGFSNISTQIVYDIIFGFTDEGEVDDISINGKTDFKKGDVFPKDAKIVITYHMFADDDPNKPEETTTKKTESTTKKETTTKQEKETVYYSSNTEDTVRNGNSGIYAYKNRGGTYDIYWVIDFDNGYVYNFFEGNGDNTCDRLKIESGDLNSAVKITWHDNGDVWSYLLHFKYIDNPNHLIVNDNDGFDLDFYPTDINTALAVKNSKIITER